METISQIKIQVKVISILASKLDEKADSFKHVKFNISANLEEQGQDLDSISLRFAFVIITQPKVVKYHIEGRTDIEGRMEEIKKVLSPHPSTRVPIILHEVYKQVYAPIFVLAKTIDAPSPSPDLLSRSQHIPAEETEEPAEEQEEVEAEAAEEVEVTEEAAGEVTEEVTEEATEEVAEQPSPDTEEETVESSEEIQVSSDEEVR